MNFSGKTFALSMGFNLFVTLVLGLGMVWLNMERVHLAYALKNIQSQVDEKNQLLSKLETERETMITPDKLRSNARSQNMGPAKPGQIRYLSDAGDEINVLRPQAASNFVVKKGKAAKAEAALAKPDGSKTDAGKSADGKKGKTDKSAKADKSAATAVKGQSEKSDKKDKAVKVSKNDASEASARKTKTSGERTPKALDFDPAN